MDWVKIKNKHILFSGLTNAEKGVLVTIQVLAAHLERVPTEREILALPGITKKTLVCLNKTLSCIEVDLKFIVKKVIDDVAEVNSRRENEKKRKRALRSKNSNVPEDVPWDIPQDIPQDSDGMSAHYIDKRRIVRDINSTDKISYELNPPPPTPSEGMEAAGSGWGDFFEKFFRDRDFQVSMLSDYLHYQKHENNFRPKDGAAYRKSLVKKLGDPKDEIFRREFIWAVSDWRKRQNDLRSQEKIEHEKLEQDREKAKVIFLKLSDEDRADLEEKTRVRLGENYPLDAMQIAKLMATHEPFLDTIIESGFRISFKKGELQNV